MTAPHETHAPAAHGLSAGERCTLPGLIVAATQEIVTLRGMLTDTPALNHDVLLQHVHSWAPVLWRATLPTLPQYRARTGAAQSTLVAQVTGRHSRSTSQCVRHNEKQRRMSNWEIVVDACPQGRLPRELIQ